MSDPMAPWTPPNAPPVSEHFEKAAAQSQESEKTQETSAASGAISPEQIVLQQEEEQLETPTAPSLRPNDPDLVNEVHRQAFLKKFTKAPDGGFEPKM